MIMCDELCEGPVKGDVHRRDHPRKVDYAPGSLAGGGARLLLELSIWDPSDAGLFRSSSSAWWLVDAEPVKGHPRPPARCSRSLPASRSSRSTPPSGRM